MSECRRRFEEGQRELLRSARSISKRRLAINATIQNQVFQSSIFLLCALLEQYILEIFEQIVIKAAAENIKLKQFPTRVRTWALLNCQMNAYRRYLHTNDERSLTNDLEITKSFYRIVDDYESFKVDHFTHDILIGNNKYPSLKNLRIVFFRFGIDNIVHEINKRGKKDYELLIDSFLDVRQEIAHQVAPPITQSDVKRHLANIKDAVAKIDRVLYGHVCQHFGANCWPI